MPSSAGSESRENSPNKETDGDDASFIRTEDIVCLVCTSGDAMKRGYLAAEGFGSQLCHLEAEPRNQEPFELWKCTFQLEEAMSVHAMYTLGLSNREKRQGSRRILMYGQAVLLRHVATKKLLRCLATSPTGDKMAYNIGFTDNPDRSCVNESCWFTVHPASKQRSEGEKVRAGDDIFLVSVANERHLSAQLSAFQNPESDSISAGKLPLNAVQACFVPCVWALHIVCSGSAKEAAIGYVNGGDVVRLIHRHGEEECLAVAARNSDKCVITDREATELCYEPPATAHLRSLWRVELFKMKLGGGFCSWGQPFRLRHVVTGKFLGVKVAPGDGGTEKKDEEEPRQVRGAVLLDSSEASREASEFCFANMADNHMTWRELKIDSMGTPQVKFGDSEVFILHKSSGKFVGTLVSERARHWSLRGSRRVVMQADNHQNFALTVTRASEEQAKAASIVQLTEDVMRNYVHRMLLCFERLPSDHLSDKLLHVLSDLCYYFRMPDQRSLSHDDFQHHLCVLKERQALFQKQGMLAFTLAVIVETGKRCLPTSPATVEVHHRLYELLAAMIRGNRSNCREFATPKWLAIFFRQLSIPKFTHDVLEVIQCLLTDSPEALNMISATHIETIVSLLHTNGRDAKVMKLLSSLCVCHGVAMRDKQRLICRHLLNCRDLLLQTSLHDQVHCVHPSLYIGRHEGSAMFHRWYYEVEITQLMMRTGRQPHFRVGWSNAALFSPRPTSNSFVTTSGGIGDDVFSIGFDGVACWVGGHRLEPSCEGGGAKKLERQKSVRAPSSPPPAACASVSIGDVIGCCIDLEVGVAWFTMNGHVVPGRVQLHHWREKITPAVSFSAGVSAVVSFGGHLGKFRYGPPRDFSSMCEAAEPGSVVTLKPFLNLSSSDLVVCGPSIVADHQGFVPAPINTDKATLPDVVMSVRDQLADNIHEVWAKGKVEAGYTYGDIRNDALKHNPSLRPFDELLETERQYDYNLALETLATLVTLGYQISSQDTDHASLPYQELPPDVYRLSNGYLPRPLDLEAVQLEPGLLELVDKLAENAHNVWAAGRITQGWTYGMASDTDRKRNPLLVPYSTLDASAKKSNYETAFQAVKTIVALGCTLKPPSPSFQGSAIHQLTRNFTHSHVRTRTFRGQSCYRLKTGKWYYEAKLLTDGMMRVGWTTHSIPAGGLLGADEHSYAYDGYLACKWHHNTSDTFGHRWKAGDVVGCLLDLDARTMAFTLNGELLEDSKETTLAFEQVKDGLMPAITLAAGERAQLNFGRSEEVLVYDYTHSGYQPICNPASLHYNVPLWYSSPHGSYDIVDHAHPRLTPKRMTSELKRCQSTVCVSPAPQPAVISLTCKDWDYTVQAQQECLRLSLGVLVSRANDAPAIPVFCPRPGPLSPTPTPDSDGCHDLRSDYFAPKKLTVSYSVVVPAGQDPSNIFIGWTTAGFRYVASQFRSNSWKESSPDSLPQHMRYGQHVEYSWRKKSASTSSQLAVHPPSLASGRSISISTAYLVCLNDLLPRSQHSLAVALRVSCQLDTKSGRMFFTASDTDARRVTFLASGQCKLFPTVISTPTTEHVVNFDLSPEKGCQSLTSALTATFQGDTIIPPCPPRVKVMAFAPSQWVRQPTTTSNFSVVPTFAGSFKLSSNRDPAYSICITLPEEDVTMDILELSEDEKLLEFHTQTLRAYSSIASHCNCQLIQALGQVADPEQLMQCLKTEGLRFSLLSAYFCLVSSLHLQTEVSMRLMMRGEFIVPLSQCTKSISLFPQKNEQQVYRVSMAPLPCLDPSLRNQANISHNITCAFGQKAECLPFLTQSLTFPVDQLKQLVFSSLEELLTTRSYTSYLLPCQGSHEIFVPLLNVLDQLLVLGELQEEADLKRFLTLLDPQEFSGRKKPFVHGLLSPEVAREEPIKLVLCRLLQHLCDCQVQHRVEAIVTFVRGYVQSLQTEQRERHTHSFARRPKEFRSSIDQQVEAMLSFKDGDGKSPVSRSLQDMLKSFHDELLTHCGCASDKFPSNLEPTEMSVGKKLKSLVQVLLVSEEQCKRKCEGDKVTTLQQLITRTMISWATVEIYSPELISEIFSLLYRQYDEVHELVQALRKTYVIEVANGDKGANYDVTGFRQALGGLRLLLKIGMGKREEELMRDVLRKVRNSAIFYCHPHLIRQLGVHSAVLELMQSYLGIAGSGENQVLSIRRKQRLCMRGLPPPVEACCKFLCKFAKINQDNQRALFSHIGYLLEHSEKHPGLMAYTGCTPLDVATATIKDNYELALALKQSHLESVVSLLVATTTSVRLATDAGEEDALRMINFGSVSCDWAPNGGEKCLDFLQSAVWVDKEEIQENAYVIVRLLIRNSECLGPALAGEAVGLLRVYEDAIDHLEDDASASSSPPDDSASSEDGHAPLRYRESAMSLGSSPSTSHRSTSFDITTLNARLVLSFYSSLVRLLACCSPSIKTPEGPTQPGNGHTPLVGTPRATQSSQQKRSMAERTRNILQNMIKEEDIVGILSLPYSSADEKGGLSPTHKEAALLYLSRVYGVTCQEVLLRLLTDAFLPDIKLTLKLVENGSRPQLCSSLCRYLTISVLPLLTKHAALFRQLLSHLHVIDNFMVCLYRLNSTSQLTYTQMSEVATFVIAVMEEFDPRAISILMPKIIGSIPTLQLHTVVSFKVLTSHHTHFAKYYETGLVGKSNQKQASIYEKTYSALVVHRVLDALAKKLPTDTIVLRHALSCLKAVSCALGPESLVPSVSQLSVMYNSSSTVYDPQPIPTARVVPSQDLRVFMREFATYQHDCYSYEKQSIGWSYGAVFSAEKLKDPKLKPFDSLPEEDQAELLTPAEDALKYLMARGWTLSKTEPQDMQSIPRKPKMICMRRRKIRSRSFNRQPEEDTTDYSSYEPVVLELSKVDIPVELRAWAELLAEYAHDRWARELKLSTSDYHSHPLYVPYELLDEGVKEERRTYALDLLRYLRLSGFQFSRTRVNIAAPVPGSQASPGQDKFATQLFNKFLSFLAQGLDKEFYLKVAFPMLTSYLTKHFGYFLPANSQTVHSFASRDEKAMILHLFCRVAEFTRLHISTLFPTSGKPKETLSPSTVKAKEAEANSSNAAAKVIVSLMEAIVKALDFKSIFEGTPLTAPQASLRVCDQPAEMTDVIEFFHQASSGVHNTAKRIGKADKVEVQVQFQFYCLNVLIPTLTKLFKHLGFHCSGRTIIVGPVLNHCRYIFQSLVEMARGSGPVFVGSSPLVAIGQCMGGFALAFPDPFLEKSMFGFSLEELLGQLRNAASYGTCGNVLFVADAIVPVLARYITRWWADSNNSDLSPVDEVLSQVLSLMAGHFGLANVQWFHRVVENSLPLAAKCSLDVLTSHFMPLLVELRERAIDLWQDEQYLSLRSHKADMSDSVERQEALLEDYRVFVRDLTTILPYLVMFLRANHDALHRDRYHVSSCSKPSPIKCLLVSVGDIFHCWFSSPHFRREFQSGTLWLLPHVKCLAAHLSVISLGQSPSQGGRDGLSLGEGSKRPPNLLIVCLEVLLPLNDHTLSRWEREVVDMCRTKMGKKGATVEELKLEIVRELENKTARPLTHKLVRQFSRPFIGGEERVHEEKAMELLGLAKIRFRMHQVQQPASKKSRWKQLLSQKRRRAVVDCFLAVPYFQLKEHRAINLFIQTYCSSWLMNAEHANHELLTEELLDHQDWLAGRREERGEPATPDPLSQLFTMFKRKASAGDCVRAELYTLYANILSKSVTGHEEDVRLANDHPTKAYELYSQWKVKLMEKQEQLARRGVATMVLLVITASQGSMCPLVHSTLELGIALLKEGNQQIQQEMLEHLRGMDVGFLSSVAVLISSCSVLDWNAYERYNKSTDLSQGVSTCHKVLPESSFTISLFRFLQLLCEGHNLAFQNYLRTQAGNTTTVNIIICTVDYLLRLQESISDFYWHYSDHETIDLQGRENFLKAFQVARQVFRTLTEYIQGPCVKNQKALARSRLWDAVSGFLHIFAILERKLYKDTSQVELLRELMDLQEELYILLLSMLEGSAMSSNIGKLMVDMLVESAQWVEDIMGFFAIFVKLKDQSTSKAFKEYDLNKDGLVSFREFEKAMEAQQQYTKEEVAFLMDCADTNHDGLLDYMEFTERFHNPAEIIGFRLCILIVHLSDHLPNDKRLRHFHNFPRGKELMEHFKRNMGCIEILGKSRRIERVYFEVKEARLQQFEEAQIQESRRQFLHTVEMGSHKNKLTGFISFCEDTIFEMDHADKISGTELAERERRALAHRKQNTKALELPYQPFMSRVRLGVRSLHGGYAPIYRIFLYIQMLWVFVLTTLARNVKPAASYLREKLPVAIRAVRQTLAFPERRPVPEKPDDSPPKSNRSKRLEKKGSLRLIIRPPPAQPAARQRPVNLPESVDRQLSDNILGQSPGVPDSRRRSTITPHTPRPFQMRQLKLEYDRSTMKKPSQYAESTLSDSASSPEVQEGPGVRGGDSYVPKITFSSHGWQSFLARNYYRLNNVKLIVTFFINLILLTFHVRSLSSEPGRGAESDGLLLQDEFYAPLSLRTLSLLHFLLSAVLILSYWHLKVPLIIFRREKHVARQLETKQMWVFNPPETLSDWWDTIVVSARSFPQKYWDKQVKQRVCEQFSPEQRPGVVWRLGLLRKSKFEERNKWDVFARILYSLADVRYLVWVLGVVLSNVLILYHIGYCFLSFFGLQWNSFYYSIHLLDLVMNFKLLRTVLRSVLHNGKQLAMTVLMTCVVIYLYTVIAFNFFRKFYREYNAVGQEVYNCESVARCFVYHIDQGLRSGGGIADVLAPASGDPSEFLRLVFDITFFFFVIVILLAIIQGLIIDAFGELRDKEELITMEMQTKCFVCGLPKTEFDHIPHGFDNHITQEHNMSHYMFFLLYLIKKQESEFSGQESYVWDMYLKRNWDFFPVGNCFYKQEKEKEQQQHTHGRAPTTMLSHRSLTL